MDYLLSIKYRVSVGFMNGPNYIHCITGEINAVLGQMKLSTRYTSTQRFYKEVPIYSETPLMRTFKSLHEQISVHTDLEGLDPMEYFGPFLDLVENPETPADLTLVALSSIDKFLLYGLVSKDSPSAITVINNIADSLCKCRFESTYSTTEESVYQYLLDILLNCIRCDSGVLLTNQRVWSIVDTVYYMAYQRSVTPLFQKSAVNSLTHIILSLFSRLRHPEVFNCDVVMPEKKPLSPLHTTPSKRSPVGTSPPEGLTPISIASPEGMLLENTTSEVKISETPCSPEDCEELVYSANQMKDEHNEDSPEGDNSVVHIVECQPEGDDSNSNIPTDECSPEDSMTPPDSSMIVEDGEASDQESGDGVVDGEDGLTPYDISLIHQILAFLISITNPTNSDALSMKYGLSVVNLLLEMNGDVLSRYLPLVELLQGNFCKYLIQNSQSDDPAVLSLTLRLIFNLFQSLKSFLKVQLEVFFTSVHIRLADIDPVSPRDYIPKEASLESLLDFCQEPTVMIDLYTNYDCDTQCTNLYERLCECLYRNSVPADKKPLTSIHTLAFQGLLAILHSIAQRCKAKDDETVGIETAIPEHAHTTAFQRRHRKKILHEFALLFNSDLKHLGWLDFAIKEGLVKCKEDVNGVAELLRETTEIDKAQLGEALAFSADRNEYMASIRKPFMRTFSFADMPLDMVLRSFLGTFLIPGEAQVIDRILSDLSFVVYESNPGPFLSSGAMLAAMYSGLMLNTDQHNPMVKDKMTFDEFKRNNRGMNDGQDFTDDYLQYLYDSIKNEQIKLLSSTADSLDLTHWEQDISYRSNKVSQAAFSGVTEEESTVAGDCEREMFILMESKALDAVKMILHTSEDQQLLQKTLMGLTDYMHITHYFGMDTLFTTIINYLCEIIPTLISNGASSKNSPATQSVSLKGGSGDVDIPVWKCVNTLRLLLNSVLLYSTSLASEWKQVVGLLFWLDSNGLMPESHTLVDITAPDNTVFPSLEGASDRRPAETGGLWTALSSLFLAEAEVSLPGELVNEVQETITECGVEDIFSKSNRMKVNSWIVLFKTLISADTNQTLVRSTRSHARMTSLYTIRLHWIVLLLSRNTDRVGMVWGLVISFLERVRNMSIDMDFKFILERFIVEIINLTNILISKPQLAEQGLALLALLEPIPSHICLSSRRVAGIYFLLSKLYSFMVTPSKWNCLFALLFKDATNEVGRPLVWQVLCRLLQERRVSLINFTPLLNCCLKTIDAYRDVSWGRQIIEFVFALAMFFVNAPPEAITLSETIGFVDNVPSADHCWLQCVAVLRAFAEGKYIKGNEIAEFAVDRLQRCLLRQGRTVPSGIALLMCFNDTMLPLLSFYGHCDRDRCFFVGVFVPTLLVSSESLARQPGFSSCWLKVIDVLCKYAISGGCLGEITVERMKNLLLVMIVEKRFDVMNEVSGQNTLEATMTMLDSYCPAIRDELDKAFDHPERICETAETQKANLKTVTIAAYDENDIVSASVSEGSVPTDGVCVLSEDVPCELVVEGSNVVCDVVTEITNNTDVIL